MEIDHFYLIIMKCLMVLAMVEISQHPVADDGEEQEDDEDEHHQLEEVSG